MITTLTCNEHVNSMYIMPKQMCYLAVCICMHVFLVSMVVNHVKDRLLKGFNFCLLFTYTVHVTQYHV